MNFYQISLFGKTRSLYTYASNEELVPGMRVLVDLAGQDQTGVIWKKVEQPPLKRIKSIREVLDDKPRLSPELQELASWMTDYYHAPLPAIIGAMLPRGLKPDVDIRIRRCAEAEAEDMETRLFLSLIPEDEWTDLSGIQKMWGRGSCLKIVEECENRGVLEVLRSYDKENLKKVNWAVLLSEVPAGLTGRQTELCELLAQNGGEMPVASLVDDFSYSILKALRLKNVIAVESRTVVAPEEALACTPDTRRVELTVAQKDVLEKMQPALAAGIFETWLLYGVTGSGKTEVYLQLMERCRALGKQALVLVPEIALTPQTVGRFVGRFGTGIAVLHSRLSERQRLAEFKRLEAGEADIVIGARSAVFAPLKRLGLIVVDEEHEHTYKQENVPAYNARDVAIVRAKNCGALVVLGSATPSLESHQNAVGERYRLARLTERPQRITLPAVTLVNMVDEPDNGGVFSARLLNELDDCLKSGHQAVLFKNRRGWASFMQCRPCGKVLKCPDCDISYTYHKKGNRLMCHYCGRVEEAPRLCPDCGRGVWDFGMPGTQQVEEQLQAIFPNARIMRLDADTGGGRLMHGIMYERMRKRQVDILLGTQMIAKGLDFPSVTLAAVISADESLNLPDFRAAERSFQLITQVAGRSGRGDTPGRVIVQTRLADHYAVKFAVKQDYNGFAQYELQLRQALCYPPYYRLARLLISGENATAVEDYCRNLEGTVADLRRQFPPPQAYLMGPVPAPLGRINNRWRWHLIIKSANPAVRSAILVALGQNKKLPAGIRVMIDVDPGNLL